MAKLSFQAFRILVSFFAFFGILNVGNWCVKLMLKLMKDVYLPAKVVQHSSIFALIVFIFYLQDVFQ